MSGPAQGMNRLMFGLVQPIRRRAIMEIEPGFHLRVIVRDSMYFGPSGSHASGKPNIDFQILAQLHPLQSSRGKPAPFCPATNPASPLPRSGSPTLRRRLRIRPHARFHRLSPRCRSRSMLPCCADANPATSFGEHDRRSLPPRRLLDSTKAARWRHRAGVRTTPSTTDTRNIGERGLVPPRDGLMRLMVGAILHLCSLRERHIQLLRLPVRVHYGYRRDHHHAPTSQPPVSTMR